MAKDEQTSDSGASLIYVVAEIDRDHPVPISWGSTDNSTGYVRILIDKNSLQIYKMEMIVDGVFLPSSDPNLNTLQNNFSGTQPFHFHNAPQGGPQFFVQQLFNFDSVAGAISTASLKNTGTGFSFAIDRPYALRKPVNRTDLGVDFVIREILAGNSYLGIHTNKLPIPATALAGDLITLADSSINGKIEWLYGGDDVVSGGNKNDLLSLGSGNDTGSGGNGNDVLDGGAGNDELLGGNGADTIWGGDDNDVLKGGNGEDLLFGNRGDDILNGENGADRLNGGAGKDIITGGNGPDTFSYGVLTDSLLTSFDVITDLQVNTDSIDGPNAVASTNLAQLSPVNSLNASDIGGVLTTGSFLANGAATFSFGARTFLAINDKNAGFQDSFDAIVEITGFSGSLSQLSII